MTLPAVSALMGRGGGIVVLKVGGALFLGVGYQPTKNIAGTHWRPDLGDLSYEIMAPAPSFLAIGTTVNADEAGSWDELHKRYEVKRINHEESYSDGEACTNWAEGFFSRMRRMEIGHHHHIAGSYLLRYAQEAAWREDNRRVANGDQVGAVVGLALNAKSSVDFSGYWQRHVKD